MQVDIIHAVMAVSFVVVMALVCQIVKHPRASIEYSSAPFDAGAPDRPRKNVFRR